jgi:hypothetical protein
MSGNIRLWVTSFLLWLLLVGNAHAAGFTLTINVVGSGTASAGIQQTASTLRESP